MKALTNKEKYEEAFTYFKASYAYKMGGTQEIVLPNGKRRFFDDRDYYEGRGAKYNSSIRHDILGEVKVSRKEYSLFLKELNIRHENKAIRLRRNKAKISRIAEAERNGTYSISEGLVELSKEEEEGCYFNDIRLATALDISEHDAGLLHSQGKTHVIAAQLSSGNLIDIYHPCLCCNDLSIYFRPSCKDMIEKLNHEDWLNAPYANLVGQSDATNHFVC